MKISRLLWMVAVAGFFAGVASADLIYTWTGASLDNDWNNPGNWDGNGVPVDQTRAHLGLGGDMMIIFDGVSTPSVNVPTLGFVHAPRIRVNKGTISLALGAWFGWWINGMNKNILTVGNGTDATALTLNSPSTSRTTFSRAVTRGQTSVVTVNSNASLTVSAALGLAFDTDSSVQVTIKDGGSLTADALLGNRWGGADSWYGLENGASLSFGINRFFRSIDQIEALYGTRFKGLAGANLKTTLDTGTGIFTLTAVPEPVTLGLIIVSGGAALFIRRRFKMF